jgi:alpha-beta hydrolase superfamily lysophospholipase
MVMTSSPAFAAERDVSVDGGKAPLYGTLLTAEVPGPAVLLIAGSGPTDRNGDSVFAGVKPASLRLIAEGLAAKGITSLRYDKRGVGKSAPALTAERDLRFSTYVDDAVRFARLLLSQPDVTCVILLGHSEGALIAPLAAQDVRTCGVISVAGFSRPFGVLLRDQLRAGALPSASYEAADRNLTELEHGREVPDVPATDPLFRQSVQPYLMSILALDPAAAIKAVRAPVLILQGGTDLQVPVEDARRLAAARPDATLVIMPGVNHVLKSAPIDRAANMATYADDRPLAASVIPKFSPS